MNFNSLAYAIFLPLAFIVYWIVPRKYRWCVLLAFSYYFYMSWSAKYVILILFTSLVSFLSALLMEGKSPRIKKLILSCTLVASLGVLFVFKYFNFISDSIHEILKLFSLYHQPTTLNLLLPIGISFYTFQTLSYVIDVYRGNIKAERNFGIYATFISFFPQLVAGPIERTSNLLPQIKKEHTFDLSKASYGLRLMLIGFFKKVVISDSIATTVNGIYDAIPGQPSGFAYIGATVLFAIQIYCDFSGYSDIAIGSAKLFDIDLMRNFNSPYFSSSVKEFWSKWHISLSTWFKDYVYIPLGGNRVKKVRHYFNLLVTFLISGLWHGANWTFVVWGGMHGIAQVFELVFLKQGKKPKGIGKAIKTALVFAFCCFAWVFFRAQSFSDAFYVLSHLFDGIKNPVEYVYTGLVALGLDFERILFYAVVILLLGIYDYFSQKKDLLLEIEKIPTWSRWAIYLIVVWFLIVSIPTVSNNEFIYFQF